MINLYCYHAPSASQSIEERYEEIAANMQNVSEPFKWDATTIDSAPRLNRGEFSAQFFGRIQRPAISFAGDLAWRDEKYLSRDLTAYDDKLSIEFSEKEKLINYPAVLRLSFPQIVHAFSSYRAVAYVAGYSATYYKLHAKELDALRARKDINVNGRNNIFTLHPAQYWDAELCGKALGYGPDEVIRRLDGQVPLVRPLMDGVYTLFNDDPDLSIEEFCAFNDRFKPVLGLA